MSEPEQQSYGFSLILLGTGTGLYSGHIISMTANHAALCCSINSGTHEITISLYLNHDYNCHVYSKTIGIELHP